jgi:hypothetical protein
LRSGLLNFLRWLVLNCDSSISDSWVARITRMSLHSWHGISFWSDRNVLQSDSDDGYMTLGMH